MGKSAEEEGVVEANEGGWRPTEIEGLLRLLLGVAEALHVGPDVGWVDEVGLRVADKLQGLGGPL